MRKFLFGLMALSLAGCSITSVYREPGAAMPAPIDAKEVKLFSGEPMSYRVLGAIAVDVMGDGEKAAALLKEKAAELGADGVIQVRLDKLVSFTTRTGANGTAVRLGK
jgi:hypothetical protein